MPPDSERNLVIAIIAQNENQALEAGAQGIGGMLIFKGYRHQIIDIYRPSGSKELLTALQSGQVAFAYAYAGVGSRFGCGANDINLWTAAQTPFVSLWFDHPAYNYLQHIVDSPYVIHAYHVRDHLEARLKYLPPSSSQSVLLQLTYGMSPEARGHTMSARQKKIIYAKTAYQPEVIAESWKRHPPRTQDILHALAALATKDRNCDLMDEAAAMFKAGGLPLENLELLMGIVQEADAYVRAWRSDRLARALLPHDAHIIGRGWDYLKDEKRKAEILPPISSFQFTNSLKDYQIIANSNPLWRDAFHERVHGALCFGGIALTDRTEKADAMFGGLPGYVGFDWHDDLKDVIAEAWRRTEDLSLDFYGAAEVRLNELHPPHSPDYVDQIIKVGESIER